jgi:16S rRNA (cytidine1402-2'-O)-methyltransferase
MATLYIIGTPIGNLEDITLRALRILKEVDCILCEDTRTTKKLLSKYSIGTPTLSYHAHSGETKIEKISELLHGGKNLALVTDAGTPAIADPGGELVSALRNMMGESLLVIAIPGPNAAIAALSISGFRTSDFLFLGFLPHKKGRETLFKEIAASKRTVVFYESPHRILKTLSSLARVLPPSKKVGIARELTKIHEQFISGDAGEVEKYFLENTEKVRGEFVVIIG